ncbi:GAF domain-containing protein [Pseudooctadecabacter jejudonensis]|uniref:histidine kinase n=1 Tax=Pseudooctadecabacter jejudonensis TaxID=1391910 RepID=A0A1Y5SY72_9RHOB|nr:GAF domain-containing protein [Pseudooctadecabacter jejudonensis]SLN51692.1 Blue-light-activated histidine kinase 1 [Pseudooctadecabacter jejudonensis]
MMDGQTADADRASLTHPRRLGALDSSGLMDSPEEAIFDRAVKLATQLTGRPVGLVSLVDGTRQFFKAQIGLPAETAAARETPLSHSFCQHVVTSNAPLVVNNAYEDPRVRDNLAIRDLDVVAYLGVPVHDPNGETLGSFCVIDNKPHEWTEAEMASLQDLSVMIETELRLRKIAQQREMLISEMNHRLKNVFALVAGMVRQSAREATDIKDMSGNITGRLQALSAAHSLILPDATGTDTEVSLRALTDTILAPYPGGQAVVRGDEIFLGPKAAVAFALSLHELATNAAKYGAFSENLGRVEVAWNVDSDRLTLTWREEMPLEVESIVNEAGFGSRLLQINVEAQLGGKLTRELTAKGAHVSLAVPVASLAE